MSDAGGTKRAVPDELDLDWLSLDEDEHVEWADHPARVSMISGIIWGIVLLPLFGLGALIIVGTVLNIKNTDYVVTNKALYVKTGILSTTIESVGLDKIQNTEYRQPMLGKQFGYATIEISTAGSGGTDLSFSAIEDARSVRETINRLSNEYTVGGGRADSESESATPPAEADPMQELLAELTATREALERAEQALREQRAGDEEGSAGVDEGESSEADASDATDPAAPESSENSFTFDETASTDDE